MIVLIIGLFICVLGAAFFLYTRLKKGGLEGMVTKALASVLFVLFAVFLTATKTGLNYYYSLAVACIISGLVCGLVGDILLDLKVMYPYHENKYLTFGMSSFGVGHIFYSASIILFLQSSMNVFAEKYLALIIIFALAVILTTIIYFASKNVMKLKYGSFAPLVNAYSFVLLFTTMLSIYASFAFTTLPMFVLAIGFVMFLISDLILSIQYFGGKQMDKKLIFFNHLFYYLAQITIAMFIFFV